MRKRPIRTDGGDVVIDLTEHFRPEIKRIISDPANWSKEFMPTRCAACSREFGEDEVPLHLWAKEGRWAMSFHFECVFDPVIQGG